MKRTKHSPAGLVNFMEMPLAKLPMKGEEKDDDLLRKSYFPHYFNTPENADYVGPYLDAQFYGDGSVDVNARTVSQWRHDTAKSVSQVQLQACV